MAEEPFDSEVTMAGDERALLAGRYRIVRRQTKVMLMVNTSLVRCMRGVGELQRTIQRRFGCIGCPPIRGMLMRKTI